MQQSLLERLFSIKEKGSTTKTEIIAGITTFFTMVYIVFVNPSVLGDAGMDKQVVFVTTCLIAALGTIAMGLFSNLPIALAPAMGLNAFFAYVVVGKLGYSWEVGLGFDWFICSHPIPNPLLVNGLDSAFTARGNRRRYRLFYCLNWL